MKKIAIYNACLERGGAERVTVYLSEYMTKIGIETEIITATKGKNEYNVPEGVKRTSIASHMKLSFSEVLKLRKVLKASGADVLLVMGVSNCIYTIPAAMGTGIKVVVSERNDPAHFAGKSYVKYLSRFLMRFAKGFVFQTADAKAFYHQWLNGRGAVIANPLITDGLPDPYIGNRKKQIVCVGRLVAQKNHQMVIKGFSEIATQYPEYSMVIYGEGPMRAQLQELIDQLGMTERISMPGNCSDLHARIRDAACFVMGSDFEGMPNALIESMAIGLPCISTDCPCGGPRALIKHGENGLLVEVGQIQMMSDAMKMMLDDQENACEMGRRAVEVRELLNVQAIGKQWEDYLNRQ